MSGCGAALFAPREIPASTLEILPGAALVESTAHVALHFKRGYMLVDSSERSQIECRSDLFVTGTVSVRVSEREQEIQELFLSSCECHCPYPIVGEQTGKSTTKFIKNVLFCMLLQSWILRQRRQQDDRLGSTPNMLLAREFVAYLSRRLVERLAPLQFETAEPQAAIELFTEVITEELSAEDQLNDEVRDILDQYADYMRREGVSYQDMFRRIKNTLVQQRKIVRASGRDTGDQMKLSRDKITDISHKLVVAMRKARNIRLKKDHNEIRLHIVGYITDVLQAEDKVDRAARAKIKTQKREIPEGTEEFDLLHKRYYAEELRKLGIDLTR